MKEVFFDALIDTAKLIPFLFLTFFLLEFIEHKLNKKNQKLLFKYQKLGPLFGGILGGLPQCGFSSMGANLFSGKVITMGTLVAIFLATSDEMFAIMLGENVNIVSILLIILAKVLIGIIVGFIVDFIYVSKRKQPVEEINCLCENEKCHCEESIIKSSFIHTFSTTIFVLIFNLCLGYIVECFGEKIILDLLQSSGLFKYFALSLVGLIPNCASSVIITEVYIKGMISIGALFAGLLSGSGVGILLLFKNNKNKRENFIILGIIYVTGVIIGTIIDIII